MRFDPWLVFGMVSAVAFVIMVAMLVGEPSLPGFPEYGHSACTSVLERVWTSTDPGCVLQRDRQSSLAAVAAAVWMVFGSGALTSFSHREI